MALVSVFVIMTQFGWLFSAARCGHKILEICTIRTPNAVRITLCHSRRIFLLVLIFKSYARMEGKNKLELASKSFRAAGGPRALILPIKSESHRLNLVMEVQAHFRGGWIVRDGL